MLSWVGNDLVEIGDKLCVGLNCLVKLSLKKTNYRHKGTQANSVHGVVVCNIWKMVGLGLWIGQSAMLECHVNYLLQIADFRPVY